MDANILVVDDEPEIADLVEVYLKSEGFTVFTCGTAAEALTCVRDNRLDLAILDVMLPDMSGFTLCGEIRREHRFPVLMLTARDETADKVTGLDCGADDYMTKPFVPDELLARVRALSRRQGEVVLEEMRYGDLTLHLSTYTLQCGAKSIHLGFKEYEVLRILMVSPHTVVPKEELLTKVWGMESDAEDNNVEVYISFLRKKFFYLGSRVGIGTVRKVGYRLEG